MRPAIKTAKRLPSRNALLLGVAILLFILSEYDWKLEAIPTRDRFSMDTTITATKTSTPHNHSATMTTKASTTTSTSIGIPSVHPRRRIVVSLKTIPSRIEYIEPTLASLLAHQTMPLHTLYLVLPKTKWMLPKEKGSSKRIILHYEIPGFLKNLTETEPRLEILRPKFDFGPVDKILFALERESKLLLPSLSTSTNLIYLDDDVLYHRDLVRTLVTKGLEYPDSVVALSGCTLKSHFRQIKHQFPRSIYDTHPNLYYRLSGTDSLPNDEVVDIVQGFAGVLVRPPFFDLAEFIDLVKAITLEGDIWKADDYIISAHLEHRNITRQLVVGHVVPTIHKEAATKDNVGNRMHRQTMQAAFALRNRLDIWSGYDFVDYLSLDKYSKDLMDCEASGGGGVSCKRAAAASDNSTHQTSGDTIRAMPREKATKLLDAKLLPLPPS